VVVVVAAAASFWLLALAMRVLPAGTAYAVWTGIGAAGTAVLGMVLFGESAAALRLACIGLIVAGVLGLKFASG
jgi:quaternary ammonium compound-resistance protein SugE